MKRFTILFISIILGIFSISAVCLYQVGSVSAQHWDWRSEYPDLNDKEAWAKIEQRRWARLEMVQGVTEFNAKNYTQAVEHFENFVKVFPNDPKGLEYLDLARKWAAKTK